MKRKLSIGILGLLALSAGAAGLVISSFDRAGKLTWTNTVGTATYRVEWAGSVTGPWQGMDALSHLNHLVASNSVVTVQVPMFYRVVWLDAPAYIGDWLYSGFNEQGSLVITGQLHFPAQAPTNVVTGTWDLQAVGDSTNDLGPQIGTGQFRGTLEGSQLNLDLNPGWADNNVGLDGRLTANTYTGMWGYSTFVGLRTKGTFVAEKRTNDHK